MMPNKSLQLIIIGLLQFAVLFSQTPSNFHYTSSDGLASSTVFQIIQDRDGFIWFATLNGMSRFDGKRFTTFRTKDGLNSNAIISLAMGDNDEIYIGNHEKGINVLKNGRIEEYSNDINMVSFTTAYLTFISSGKNEQKLYSCGRGIINVVHEQLLSGRSGYSISASPHQIINIKKLSDNEIIALATNGLYTLKNDSLTKIHIKGLPDTTVYCLTKCDDSSYMIGTKGMMLKIKNNKIARRYNINLFDENEITHIFSDRNNNIWFSIINKGFFLIPNGSDEIINMGSKMSLENTLVNDYLEDNEGNIWISTYGKGAYCLNNLYLKSYNENDGMSNNVVQSIEKGRMGNLFIGTSNGINVLKNDVIYQVKDHSGKNLDGYIYCIKSVKDSIFVCTSSENSNKNISYNGLNFCLLLNPSFTKTSDGLYLFGNWDASITCLREINFSKKNSSDLRYYISKDTDVIKRAHIIFEDSKKNIWIGTNLGLFKLSNPSGKLVIDPPGQINWEKSFYPSNHVLNSRINSIFQDQKNHVWIAGEKGIASYNLDNDSIKTYSNINGFDLSSSTSIISDNRNRIWVGNMKGLYLLDGNSIKYLNRQTGLPSDEVLSLYFDNDENMVYIGTSFGMSSLDVNLFENYHLTPPTAIITGIKAGDSVYTSHDNLVFKPSQHDVSISFVALNFSSPGTVNYKYKLNDEWNTTDRDFLNFVSLKHGTYQLQLMAKAQNTDWGKPCLLTFRVLPRFTETIWFDLLIISIVIMVAMLILSWRIKLNNKKVHDEMEQTERTNELKHQALSAMMNPHFISNALNSVQYLVNTRRHEEANDYIAMMAQLMRKNLDTAGSGFILLSEEITRLKLYLNIEKLRFQQGFTFEIITGTDVDTNAIMIPNMIIQPFAENSLWHGIINSVNRGLLTVSFSFEDVEIDMILCRSLIIKITDNGIGIQEAKKNKKEDHISKGIHIIEERLKLLSTKMHLPHPILFEDLSNRDNNSCGTEVIISLPPPLYKITVSGFSTKV